MATVGAKLRACVQQWLSLPPRQTPHGVIGRQLRSAEFGSKGGGHGELHCWVYQRRDTDLEMLFAFYDNFTPDDLICKVVDAGAGVRPGEGASIQFNADRCVRSVGYRAWELTHHGRVTAGEAIS